MTKMRHAYTTPRKRVPLDCSADKGKGAKQSMKDECDINNILAKYQVSGQIDHVNKYRPKYGFATSLDFREALELTRSANAMFAELPSSVREKFHNNPAEFLDYAQDPANQSDLDYMQETGKMPEKTPETAPPAEPPAATPDETT